MVTGLTIQTISQFSKFDAVRHLTEAYQRKGVFQKLKKMLFPFSGTNRNTVFMKYKDTSLKNTFLQFSSIVPS